MGDGGSSVSELLEVSVNACKGDNMMKEEHTNARVSLRTSDLTGF